MTYRITYEDCEERFRELIEKHIKMNRLCFEWDMIDDDMFEALTHVGAITGLRMLLKELDGEVEY